MLDGLKERAKFKGLTEAIDSERRQPLQVADDRLIERVRAQPDLEAEAVRTGVRQSPDFHRGLVEAIVKALKVTNSRAGLASGMTGSSP